MKPSKQMSSSFLKKLQDKKQFNSNNYGSHMEGVMDDSLKMSGKVGMSSPNKSMERIMKKRKSGSSSSNY